MNKFILVHHSQYQIPSTLVTLLVAEKRKIPHFYSTFWGYSSGLYSQMVRGNHPGLISQVTEDYHR